MPESAYQDINALIMLYKMGELPADTLVFQYYAASGKVAYAHIDEIKKHALLASIYPITNSQKGKK